MFIREYGVLLACLTLSLIFIEDFSLLLLFRDVQHCQKVSVGFLQDTTLNCLQVCIWKCQSYRIFLDEFGISFILEVIKGFI